MVDLVNRLYCAIVFCFYNVECPFSTYKDFLGYAATCTACPANSGHQKTGSTTIRDCKCFVGYDGTPENGNDCRSESSRLLTNRATNAKSTLYSIPLIIVFNPRITVILIFLCCRKKGQFMEIAVVRGLVFASVSNICIFNSMKAKIKSRELISPMRYIILSICNCLVLVRDEVNFWSDTSKLGLKEKILRVLPTGVELMTLGYRINRFF